MIKILKLQKAVFAIVGGVLALVAYFILYANEIEWSSYLLTISGAFFILGALMFLYPILFSRKDSAGCVELDPNVPIETIEEEHKP